ncbi:MAG: integration host factor subunit beta [Bernardetiaceae bacterium]|nr:integration host factor subunit beta [Bernardetiaceae bacterium]
MTKADLIAQICKTTDLDKFIVQDVLEEFFEAVKENMAAGENIYVRGFGSFVNKKRAKKIGRNISQKKPVVIEAHYVPSFKPSKLFVESVKNSKKVWEANEDDDKESQRKEETVAQNA